MEKQEAVYRDISFTIQPHPRRKRMAIGVTEAGEVIVKTPPRVSMKRVQAMVEENYEWILSSREKMLSKAESTELTHQFAEGEHLPLFGRECRIQSTEGESYFKAGVFYLHGNTPQERGREAVKLYKAIAQKILTPMTERIAGEVGVKPRAVKIGRAGKSWGYCKRDGTITFSLRLAAMEEGFVRYVVVHELCHILHFDHSPSFWREVERVFPGGKAIGNSLAVKEDTAKVARLFNSIK